MLTVLRVHLPSEIPVVGCEVAPYVLLKRGDGAILADAVSEFSPVDGCFLRYKWYRIQSDLKVCSIHPSEKAAIQCLGCIKAKVSVARSYHCSSKCFADAWQYHRALHERASNAGHENGAEDDELYSRPGCSGPIGQSPGYYSGSTPVHIGAGPGRGGGSEICVEVGRSKTYTPTADDIGQVLKFECVPVDVETRIPVGATQMVLTSRVIPAPAPIPRRLIPVSRVDPIARYESDVRNSSIGTFVVLSYNILCETYATNESYSYCPSWALSWSYRRQNLLREIVSYNADIICLQEVQSNHFEDFFSPELDKHGYQSLFKKKTSEVYNGNPLIIDGCATFFRKDRFLHVKKYEVEFNKAAQSLTDAVIQAPPQKKAALGRLIKDNVALIAVLEAKSNNHSADPSGRRQLLCVANTHINVHQELRDVKLWQVNTLLKGLEKIASSGEIPMLVCGDFNSLPGSAPHSLLARGKVDPMHPDLAIDPLGILYPPTKLIHQLPLVRENYSCPAIPEYFIPSYNFSYFICNILLIFLQVSAYSSFARIMGVDMDFERQKRRMDPSTNEPLFTHITRDFVGTHDYIFYTADTLMVESLLELLDEESLRKDTALPSPEWPSDHLALLAEFRCISRSKR